MKILVIEDEVALSESIVDFLTSEGHVCEAALDFEAAMDRVGGYEYDCVIVDITLPDGSGLEVIRKIKSLGLQCGVIIISAKNSVENKIEGLEIGADDYLAKPFHLSELNARLKSVIRRLNFQGSNIIEMNEIKIVPDELKVYVHDQLLVLTKKEYDLLLFFIANQNRVITKISLVGHLWGDDIYASDSVDFIYTHIKNLKKKLLEKGCEDYLQNVYGVGYKFKTK